MTLAELISEWRRRTDDNAAGYRNSDEFATYAANLAESEAAIRAKLLYDTASTSVTTGVSVYASNPKIWLIDSAVISDSNGKKNNLVLTDRETLSKQFSDWRLWQPQTPKYLIVESNKIELSPVPEKSYTLTTYHYRTPLTLMSETTSSPEINSIHHDGLVDYMVFLSSQNKDADNVEEGLARLAIDAFTVRFGKRPDANVLRKQARKGSHTTRPLRI